MDWLTKWSWNTTYSADSVEWCPVENYTDALVCGTYQLTKDEAEGSQKNQTRVGRIYLFVINATTKTLEPVQTIHTFAILDQKWCSHKINGHPVLVTATSHGNIQMYQLSKLENVLHLKLWFEQVIGPDLLALSLDWSTNKLFSQYPNLAVSDSSGRITLWQLDDCKLNKCGEWNVHSFEAWITAFNYWSPDILYSGGDDCLFKCLDKRVADVAVSTNRIHGAGVTSIRSHIDVENHLLTGSYDEIVRLWDTRNLNKSTSEINVKGGVWRLKWHPHKTDTILVACMYGGFRTLTLSNQELVISSEYLDHDSIAYGADWRHDNWSLVATCSFYDCKMNLSEIQM